MSLMQKPLPSEQLLAEVDEVIRTMPSVASFESAGPEHYAWLGRASALVHRWDPIKAIAKFDGYIQQLGSGSFLAVPQGAQGVLTMLHQVRYDAILHVQNSQNTNIASGSVFDYFDGVRKVIELAKSELLFVDPYLDAEFVSRYLPTVAQGVSIRLLASEKMATLVPAATLYKQQSGAQLNVRSVNGLHDRYLFVDRTVCYQSGASFKDGAKKASTTFIQVTDVFQAVLTTYETLWSGATVHL